MKSGRGEPVCVHAVVVVMIKRTEVIKLQPTKYILPCIQISICIIQSAHKTVKIQVRLIDCINVSFLVVRLNYNCVDTGGARLGSRSTSLLFLAFGWCKCLLL